MASSQSLLALPKGSLSRVPEGDTTVSWEHYVLAVLPSALLLICGAFRLDQLWKVKLKALPNYMGAVKAVYTAVFAAINLAALVQTGIADQGNAYLLTSTAVNFAAAVLLCPLSFFEHGRTVRPSALIILYAITSLICDMTLLASTSIGRNGTATTVVTVLCIVAKFVLLVVESWSKRSFLREPYRTWPPEATSSIINRAFLWWVNPILIKGNNKILSNDDLFPLDADLSSGQLRDEMRRAWEHRSKQGRKYELPWAVLKCFHWPILAAFPMRLMAIVFRYAQPLLISRIITFVTRPKWEAMEEELGYRFVVAAFIVYAGLAISSTAFGHMMNRVKVMVRGGLIGLIHDHALEVPDGTYHNAMAITLMSSEVDRITFEVPLIHEVWAQLLEFVVGVYLLARELQWACITPLFIIIFCSRVSAYLGKNFGPGQRAWSIATQNRLAVTNSMLDSIKGIKMLGLAGAVQSDIERLRLSEIDTAVNFRTMFLMYNASANFLGIFCPVLTLAAFAVQSRVWGSGALDTNTAFTALATMSLVTNPANMTLSQIPRIAVAMTSFDRIQKYLLDRTREDKRLDIDSFSHTQSQSESESETQLPLAIEMDKVTIRPSPTAKPVLEDITVVVPKRSVTIITGVVGAGKTSFARAVLGDIIPDTGTVSVSSRRMGYCSQTPWLPNGTIKEVICGSNTEKYFDNQWYNRVLNACGLIEDLASFPHGDQSILGSRGLTLSGGQRQRVALCRAVYARFPIIVLDDVLSALDIRTEAHVVKHLLGESHGIFQELGTTVVLITHASRHFPLADQIILLDSTQQGAKQGTWDEMKSQLDVIIKDVPEGTNTARYAGDLPVEKLLPPTTAKTSFADEMGDATRQQGDSAVYGYYFRAIGYPDIFLLGTFTAVYSFFLLFPQYWVNWWTKDDGKHTTFYIVGFVLLSTISYLATNGNALVTFLRIMPKSGVALHHTLLTTIIRAPQSYFATTDTGITLNRFGQDLGVIDRQLPNALQSIFTQIFKLLTQTILLFSTQWLMAVSLPICLVVVYLVQKVYLYTSRQFRLLGLESRSAIYSDFLETLEGLATIRAFSWQSESVSQNISLLDISQTPWYSLLSIQRWLSLVLNLLIAGIAVMVVALAMFLKDSTSGGQIGIALNMILVANATLLALVQSWTELETSLGAIARMKALETTVQPEDKPNEDQIPRPGWPENGRIEIRDLTASYNSETTAFNNVNLTIEPGQKIGICGRTGSGKSSLLLSILRLIEIQSGTIFIDGLDIQRIPRNEIRKHIIAVPQDPFILNDTVRVNADPSHTCTDEEIISALEKVGLWEILKSRHHHQTSNPSTDDTNCYSDQISPLSSPLLSHPLSIGQQQLFSLSRAILRRHHSRILLLDEATSSLDPQTDDRIQKVLREEFRGHTVVSVAHRLDTIVGSDKVVVMDGGEVVEVGVPEELLNGKAPSGGEGGWFERLWRAR